MDLAGAIEVHEKRVSGKTLLNFPRKLQFTLTQPLTSTNPCGQGQETLLCN